MEIEHFGSALIFSLVIALSLASFSLSLTAEYKKSKKEDLRVDGKQCYLPGSHAFGLGIAALICLIMAQIMGSCLICSKFCLGLKRRSCKSAKVAALLVLSWISFGLATILIGVASSMNRSQPFGEGWLDGECYIAKDGVYIGSGVLTVFALGTTVTAAVVTTRKSPIEPDTKVYAQVKWLGVGPLLAQGRVRRWYSEELKF